MRRAFGFRTYRALEVALSVTPLAIYPNPKPPTNSIEEPVRADWCRPLGPARRRPPLETPRRAGPTLGVHPRQQVLPRGRHPGPASAPPGGPSPRSHSRLALKACSLLSSSSAVSWTPALGDRCLGRPDSRADQRAVATLSSSSTRTGTSPEYSPGIQGRASGVGLGAFSLTEFSDPPNMCG